MYKLEASTYQRVKLTPAGHASQASSASDNIDRRRRRTRLAASLQPRVEFNIPVADTRKMLLLPRGILRHARPCRQGRRHRGQVSVIPQHLDAQLLQHDAVPLDQRALGGYSFQVGVTRGRRAELGEISVGHLRALLDSVHVEDDDGVEAVVRDELTMLADGRIFISPIQQQAPSKA